MGCKLPERTPGAVDETRKRNVGRWGSGRHEDKQELIAENVLLRQQVIVCCATSNDHR